MLDKAASAFFEDKIYQYLLLGLCIYALKVVGFWLVFNRIRGLPGYNRSDIIRIFLSVRNAVSILIGVVFLLFFIKLFIPKVFQTLIILDNEFVYKALLILFIMYVFRIALILNRYLFGVLCGLAEERKQLEKEKIRATYGLVKNIFYVLLSFIGIISIWTVLFGNESAAVLQMIGFLAGGLSVAAQKTVMDLINGVLILRDNSIKIDDWIEFEGKTAVVEEIALRFMRIRYDCGMLVTIPFHALTVIKNKARQYSYVVYDMSFDITVPMETAHKAVLEAFGALTDSEKRARLYKDNIEVRDISDLTGFSYVMQYRICVQPKWQYYIQRAFNKELKIAFEKYNINIARPMVANVKSVPSLTTGKEYPDQP